MGVAASQTGPIKGAALRDEGFRAGQVRTAAERQRLPGAGETDPLPYSYDKALAALRALTVPDAQQRHRLIWAYEHLIEIPRGGLPDNILKSLREIDGIFDAMDATRLETSWPVRIDIKPMHWKKRGQCAEKITSLIIEIVQAFAVRMNGGAKAGTASYPVAS